MAIIPSSTGWERKAVLQFDIKLLVVLRLLRAKNGLNSWISSGVFISLCEHCYILLICECQETKESHLWIRKNGYQSKKYIFPFLLGVEKNPCSTWKKGKTTIKKSAVFEGRSRYTLVKLENHGIFVFPFFRSRLKRRISQTVWSMTKLSVLVTAGAKQPP